MFCCCLNSKDVTAQQNVPTNTKKKEDDTAKAAYASPPPLNSPITSPVHTASAPPIAAPAPTPSSSRTRASTPRAPASTPATAPPRPYQMVAPKNDFAGKFETIKKLGAGAYGDVFAAKELSTGNHVAIKMVQKKKLGKDEDQLLHTEVSILMSLSHPNIISCYDFYADSKKYVIVLEMVTGGELFDKIVEKNSYSELDARNVILFLLSSIKHCHDNDVVHRDLKPENLLLVSPDDDKSIKLADFGFAAKVTDGPLTGMCGSPGYICPEMIKNQKHGKPSDMWSIGIITYVVLGGYLPFNHSTDAGIAKLVVKGVFQFHDAFWNGVSGDGKDLIRKLLVQDPSKRLTVDEALAHPWIKLQADELSRRPTNNIATLRRFQRLRRFRACVRVIISVNKMAKVLGTNPRTAIMQKATEIAGKDVVVPGWEDDFVPPSPSTPHSTDFED